MKSSGWFNVQILKRKLNIHIIGYYKGSLQQLVAIS